MEAHIETVDLQVSLSGRPVLDAVSMRAPAGSWVGLIGPNGSGKTTFLRTVAGLLPYAGSARIAEREVSTWSVKALARALAFVRQSASMSFDFSVSDYVLLGRIPYGGPLRGYSDDDMHKLNGVLGETDLLELATRSILELSGGELQRVVLAQALLQDPDVLLLDEPTTHLDVEHQFRILTVVARRVASHGLTVLSSFHDLELASRFADQLVVLSGGSLAASGAPTEVLQPELLESVFRMRASVGANESPGSVRIAYHGPAR